MNAAAEDRTMIERPCDAAKRRLRKEPIEPIMYSDWTRVLFINLEVDKAALQREVPFSLDLYDGRALISLVAFTVSGMHPRFAGPLGSAVFKPIQIGELFNVRTYVRCRGEPGIYFLAEWLGSRINLKLGPLAYGLPYRLGVLRYRYDDESGHAEGEICDRISNGQVRYRAGITDQFTSAVAGSIDEFLIERYTCFTQLFGLRRFFRIWHPEWPQARVELQHFESDLLVANWPWMREARIISANYSPGLRNVWLGRPHLLKAEPRSAFLKLP